MPYRDFPRYVARLLAGRADRIPERTPEPVRDALRAQAGLLDLAHNAIIVRDAETNTILYWNRGAEAAYGWTRDEALGAVTHDQLRTDFPEPSEAIDAALLREDCREGELIHTRRDGTRLEVESRQALERDERGAPALILEINRDVTERKRAEAPFRGLLESAPDGVVAVDPGGRIALVNRQAEAMFGYPRAEMLGRPVELLLPESLRGIHERQRTEYRADPRVRPMGIGMELLARRRDGSEFPVEISLSPLESGGERLVTAVIRDVTERKRLERRLADDRFRTLVQNSSDVITGEQSDPSTAVSEEETRDQDGCG